MFNIDLIEACYLNDFNVDLKAFHKKKFEGITAELSEEVLKRPIIFEDFISKSFNLKIFNN